MPAPILATKLHIPTPRPQIVPRPCLVGQLNAGLASGRKLTLISASAGFGKTTLLSEWLGGFRLANEDFRLPGGSALPLSNPESKINHLKSCWLSLDEADSDPARFLLYLVSALQTVAPEIGQSVLAALQTPQPPPAETLLTSLLNEIITLPQKIILVLDDYHLLDSPAVDAALGFLLDHLPPQLHLVIASREDPNLPLPRLRAGGQLTELRAADLRFTPVEAADFLNRVMGLNLSEADVAALESRTEGWIAGLQLAALSIQGQADPASFIQSFTGSHRFVLDYLLEEVLHRQPPNMQAFLLRTSILERLCGSLCDAVLADSLQSFDELRAGSSVVTIESLDRANLFIIPLDNERRWYRYHHLFGDLLRKRLEATAAEEIAILHLRASEWYERNDLVFEAFRHAAAANDIGRAERLIGHPAIGLHFRSVAIAILEWLASLPKAVLEAHPRLLVRSATLSLLAGKTTGVEEKLQAAEAILQTPEPDVQSRDLLGQVACARATIALTRYDPATMILQARRALELLSPENLTFRFTANWALTAAYLFQGDRGGAAKASQEGIVISQKSGDPFSHILATSTLGLTQELDNQLFAAAETYRRVLALFGDYPQPNAEEAYLGLARIHYEWNDLEAAETYGQRALQMARQYDRAIDRFVLSEVFLAQLKLVRGEVDAAAALLAQTEQSARQKNFILRLPEIAAAQVLLLLKQGNAPAAADLARQFDLPLGQARTLLAQDDPAAALVVLAAYRQQTEAKAWQDEHLKVLALQSVALRLAGDQARALATLAEALSLAEPGGFLRLFLDEGETMRLLIADFRFSIGKTHHNLLAYAEKLLVAFPSPAQSAISNQKSEILSPRELEILRLIAQGLSNQEIGERLFLALDTVKGHNRRIFDKLQVTRRTEAIARARALGLL